MFATASHALNASRVAVKNAPLTGESNVTNWPAKFVLAALQVTVPLKVPADEEPHFTALVLNSDAPEDVAPAAASTSS